VAFLLLIAINTALDTTALISAALAMGTADQLL
jgi:hypothetical protein